MKFPLFASFIIFIIWLTYELSKRSRLDDEAFMAFWQKEHRANRTRRKSLDGLDYISIPLESLPLHILPDDEKAAEYRETLNALSDLKIVNLTGITNTDLKLEYGAPNIDLLGKYDQNYTVLARTLDRWAAYLYEQGYAAEARTVLEFAVSTKTDVSSSYKLLCRIYMEESTPEKIQALYPIAESLNSIMKNSILNILREAGQ